MTNPDALPRLADALIEVSDRLQNISNELRAVHAADAPRFPTYPAPVPPAYAAPPPYAGFPRHAGSHHPPFLQFSPPTAGPMAPPPDLPPRQTLWERVSREGAGSRIVAWVGAVVTLAGVVLLLVLAIQRGYIGPAPRIALGAGLGAALVAIAVRLHAAPGGRTGAHALAATGTTVGYLDVVSATSYYHFLPPWAGLTTGLAVAAVGVLIAPRWDSQLLATFGVLACAVSAPLLTTSSSLLVGFLLVLQIASGPAQLRRRWGALAVVAAVPPLLAVLLTVAVRALGSSHDSMTVAFLCLITSVVQILIAVANAQNRTADEVAIGLLLAAPIPALISAILLPRYAGLAVVGGIALLLLAITLARRYAAYSTRFADACSAAALAAVFEATCIAFAGDVRAVALLAGATLLAVLAARLRTAAAFAAAAVFGAGGLALALGGALRFDLVAVPPSAAVSRADLVSRGSTGVLLAVAALTVAWAAGRVVRPADQASVHTRWAVAGALALYGATATIVSIALAVSPDRHGFVIGHMAVTLSWTVGALVLLLRHVDSTPLRVAGLALVGAALTKLVLFDLSSLNGIPRVLAFLGGGLVLLAAGARYARLVSTRAAEHLGSQIGPGS